MGYLILKGKCKFCHVRISLRYPIIEALTGFFSLISVIKWGFPENIIYFGFISALIVITFIDLDFQIIPDIISLPGIALGYVISVFIFKRGFFEPLIAIITGGGIFYAIGKGYELIKKIEGLGGGDVKLMAMFGAFLGIKAIPFIILVSSLTGTVVGIYLMIFKKKDSKFAIPFGPFLCFGAVLYIFFGQKVIDWYINLL